MENSGVVVILLKQCPQIVGGGGGGGGLGEGKGDTQIIFSKGKRHHHDRGHVSQKAVELPFCQREVTFSGAGAEVIKPFSCSSQLSLKFILLINVKMPTIVGILTFMSRINYCFLSFEFSTNFGYFNIYEQLKFHAQLS